MVAIYKFIAAAIQAFSNSVMNFGNNLFRKNVVTCVDPFGLKRFS